MQRLCAIAVVSFVLCVHGEVAAAAERFPAGSGEQTVKLKGEELPLFTYRPDCREPSLLIVLHGASRKADDYRDWLRPLADQHCLLVAAPRFAKKRFPRWRYQHGGITRRREVRDPGEWTGNMIVALAEQVRALEGRIPYSLIGHSAGGQFLSRLAAFVPTEARRIVIANPGTLVFPDAKVKAPYGLGGVYPDSDVDGHLRRYLNVPVTIYLGQEDTDDEGLNASAKAMAQGSTRHERGLNAFRAAQSLAGSHAWTLNWRLVETPGVGHSAEKMFAAKEAWEALKP